MKHPRDRIAGIRKMLDWATPNPVGFPPCSREDAEWLLRVAEQAVQLVEYQNDALRRTGQNVDGRAPLEGVLWEGISP